MDYSKQSNKNKRMKRKLGKEKVANTTGLLIFRAVLAVFLIAGFAAVGALAGAYFGILQGAPKLSAPKILPNIYSSFIVDKNMKEIDMLEASEIRTYVTSDNIAQSFKDALVAIEDDRFYTHNGIDIRSIFRAIKVNLTTDRTEGASTITQQLIKNNILGRLKNTLESKLQEQYIAIQYEKYLVESYGGNKRAAKDYILEVYMNSVAFGHNINGVQSAANYYFDKDAADLTLSESAVIAGITQYPSKYVPDTKPEENKKRRKMVLDRMLELEIITQREYDEAMADDPYPRISQSSQVIARQESSSRTYFNDHLITTVVDDLMEKYLMSEQEAFHHVYNGGLTIVSTQDLAMQKIIDDNYADDSFFPESDFKVDIQYYLSTRNRVTNKVTHHPLKRASTKTMDEDAINAEVDAMRDKLLGANDDVEYERIIPVPQPQSAMVILDYHNGEVKALTGGRGDKLVSMGLNRATMSERQPGSVFKVLASFGPGIDMGLITPATVIDDAPFVTGNDHQFKNWYSGYRGLNTIRTGVYNSMNILAVKNMNNIGIDNCFNYLMNFGFTTLVDREEIRGQIFTDRTLSTALGGITRGITQLEVAAAYGTIANGGIYQEPIFYTKVLDHDGNTLLEPNAEPRRVLKAQSAYLLTNMMQDVLTIGTGTKARFSEVKMPIAGKTGTTSDTKDLSFVGYTPYYVASIWLGFDQPEPMYEDKGYHTKLWGAIMEQIHVDLEEKEFERPDGIVSASICRQSGKLAVSGLCDHDPRGSMIRSEIFMAGTQPTESCDVHVSVVIDTSTGMKAGAFCPPDLVETQVKIVRPIPYTGTDAVGDQQYEIKREVLDGPECTHHSADTVPHGYYVDPLTGLLMPIVEDGEGMDDPLNLPGGNPLITPTPTPTPTRNPFAPVTPTPLPGLGGIEPTPRPTPLPTPTPVPDYTPPAGFGTEPTPRPTATPSPPPDELPIMNDPSVDEFVY